LLGLIFTGLSVKSFGGLIQWSGTDTFPHLEQSSYGQNNYYVFSYNDSLMALGSLFVLLMVNNSHIVAKGVEIVTSGSSCRLFFIAWYTLGVLFILNLFTASILTSFMNFWLARHQTLNTSAAAEQVGGDGGGGGGRGDLDDEFDLPIRMTTHTLDHPKPSISSPGNGHHGESITSRKTDTQRLSQLMRNQSLRMRYSNLDDEVFQWMTNFQDSSTTARPSITSPPSRMLHHQRRGSGLERPVEHSPPVIEMDQLSRSRAGTIESLSRLTGIDTLRETSSLPYIPEDHRDSESGASQDDIGSTGREDYDGDDTHRLRSHRYLSTISAFPHLPPLDAQQQAPATLCDPRAWFEYYQSQKKVSVSIVEYTATLLQCAKNGREKVKFTSRAAYLCYRVTKTVRKNSFTHSTLTLFAVSLYLSPAVLETLPMGVMDPLHLDLLLKTKMDPQRREFE
jgi:hypothetical protein